MALTNSALERIASWCDTSSELTGARTLAWARFFATDEAGSNDYEPGTGDHTSRHRRFLGWFMFQARLPTGELPAELAASALFDGQERAEALRSISHARYVMAVVSTIMPGSGVMLELQDERFEVRSRTWAQVMRRGALVAAHLVPARRGVWLPGPGWMEWPVSVGPNMRRELRKYQSDPIEVERVLQGRSHSGAHEIERPRDATLDEAVARMTTAAQHEGRPGLIMPAAEWESLVLQHLKDLRFTAFAAQVVERVGDVEDVQELNHWLALAQNIWNTTPQPDRGGRTAYELGAESSEHELEIESWHN